MNEGPPTRLFHPVTLVVVCGTAWVQQAADWTGRDITTSVSPFPERRLLVLGFLRHRNVQDLLSNLVFLLYNQPKGSCCHSMVNVLHLYSPYLVLATSQSSGLYTTSHIHPFTHIHSGAIWGSLSCPRTLWLADWRSLDSDPQPSC